MNGAPSPTGDGVGNGDRDDGGNAASLVEATVAIVGLGLMGSSLGLALDGHVARRLGADVHAPTAARALGLGAVDATGEVPDIVRDADVVVLATPVGEIVATAPAIAARMRRDAVLTDLGSTKTAICDAFDGLPVATVGSHPMCGRELSGPDAATAALFRDATWVLSPTRGTTPAARSIVGAIIDATGAQRVDVDRDVHDRAVATASHLPFVLAHALSGALVEADARTSGIASRLAATGFRGATRLAGGDVQMWLDILATNEQPVRESIAELHAQLDRLVDALDDAERLERLLRDGRASMQAVREP